MRLTVMAAVAGLLSAVVAAPTAVSPDNIEARQASYARYLQGGCPACRSEEERDIWARDLEARQTYARYLQGGCPACRSVEERDEWKRDLEARQASYARYLQGGCGACKTAEERSEWKRQILAEHFE